MTRAVPLPLPQRHRFVVLIMAALLVVGAIVGVAVAPQAAKAETVTQRYIVVLAGKMTESGFQPVGDVSQVRTQIATSGATIAHDLSAQIGVFVVDSATSSVLTALSRSTLVDVVAQDFKWKAFPTMEEAIAGGQLTVVTDSSVPGGGPEPGQDTLEFMQWSMRLVCAEADPERPETCPEGAHAYQAGSRLVEVGVLDTGIDSAHLDFQDDDGGNVNCAKGQDFIPAGPGIGLLTPCTDNNFHGTHVAGIIGAQANGDGVEGVASDVELIPVKVCDSVGYCYASSTAAGITYSGDMKFEVINMSFFVDDDVFLESTEFKCMNDPVQRAFRKANERAIQYARNQGVVPVAALGNSDQDLAHPPEPYENDCEVVPAETEGVIGTMALGRFSEKAFFSNYGVGATDVGAPGGSYDELSDTPDQQCEQQVLSTIPGNLWACFQGTSMASPHAAGVAALIVSQFGRVANDAGELDVVMRPQQVENYLQSTTVDIGLPGYDECFGNGRANALRAVLHDTSSIYDPAAPPCPEYEENQQDE